MGQKHDHLHEITKSKRHAGSKNEGTKKNQMNHKKREDMK